MTEEERQRVIANHIDITPHESEISRTLNGDRLYDRMTGLKEWWALEAALQELEREYQAKWRQKRDGRAFRLIEGNRR